MTTEFTDEDMAHLGMSGIVTRMRLQAEDLHSINPASETVKCLSLGADEITTLRAQLAESKRKYEESVGGFKRDLQEKLDQQRAKNQRLQKQLATVTQERDEAVGEARFYRIEGSILGIEYKKLQEQLAAAQADAERIGNLTDLVSKALRRAWQLGQTYWQQADSDFASQHKKSDETHAKFQQLVDETCAAMRGKEGD